MAPGACSHSVVLLAAGAKALNMALIQTLRRVQSLFAAPVPDALPAPLRRPQAKMQYPAQTDPTDTPVVWRDSESRPTESMVSLRMFARSYVFNAYPSSLSRSSWLLHGSSAWAKTAHSPPILASNITLEQDWIGPGPRRATCE